MSVENKPNESVEQDSKLLELKPEELVGIIKDLRKENGEKRVKFKEIEEKLTSFEKAQLEAEEKKKLEEGKKDEIIESYKKKLAELEPKANQFDSFLTSKRESAKEKLGDKWKESYGNLPIADLESLVETLSGTSVDVEKQGKTPKKYSLTEEDKKKAAIMGLSEEMYAQLQIDARNKGIIK